MAPTTLVLGVLIVVGVLCIFMGISLKRFFDSRRKRSWSREKVELRYDRLHSLQLPVNRKKMLKRLTSDAGSGAGRRGGGGGGGEEGGGEEGGGGAAAEMPKEELSRAEVSVSRSGHRSPSRANQHPQFKDIYLCEQPPATPTDDYATSSREVKRPRPTAPSLDNDAVRNRALPPTVSGISGGAHPSGAIPKTSRLGGKKKTASAPPVEEDSLKNAGYSHGAFKMIVNAETHEEPRDSGVSSVSTASSKTFLARLSGAAAGADDAASDAAVVEELRHQDMELRHFEKQCAEKSRDKRRSLKRKEDRLTQLGWRRDDEDDDIKDASISQNHDRNNKNNHNSARDMDRFEREIETTAI